MSTLTSVGLITWGLEGAVEKHKVRLVCNMLGSRYRTNLRDWPVHSTCSIQKETEEHFASDENQKSFFWFFLVLSDCSRTQYNKLQVFNTNYGLKVALAMFVGNSC